MPVLCCEILTWQCLCLQAYTLLLQFHVALRFTHWCDKCIIIESNNVSEAELTVFRNLEMFTVKTSLYPVLLQSHESLQLGVSSSPGHIHPPQGETSFSLLCHCISVMQSVIHKGKYEWKSCEIDPYPQSTQHLSSFTIWATCNLDWTVRHLSGVALCCLPTQCFCGLQQSFTEHKLCHTWQCTLRFMPHRLNDEFVCWNIENKFEVHVWCYQMCEPMQSPCNLLLVYIHCPADHVTANAEECSCEYK